MVGVMEIQPRGNTAPGSYGDSTLDTHVAKNRGRNGDTTCVCGLDTENKALMLRCYPLLHHCTMDTLLKVNDMGKECAEQENRKVS